MLIVFLFRVNFTKKKKFKENKKMALTYEWFQNTFADSAAWMIILCGAMFLVWFFYEGIRKGFWKSKKEEWNLDTVSKGLKIVIFLGIFIGMLMIATAIITMIADLPPSFKYRDNVEDHFDWLTSISLLIFGLVMFIKPITDVPWATLIGLLAGAAVAIIIAIVVPQDLIDYGQTKIDWDIRWVIVIIFVVISTIVGLCVKFWIAGIEFLAKFMSWPPVAIILAVYCFIQGIGLLATGFTFYQF
jgi:hypothetical protein